MSDDGGGKLVFLSEVGLLGGPRSGTHTSEVGFLSLKGNTLRRTKRGREREREKGQEWSRQTEGDPAGKLIIICA